MSNPRPNPYIGPRSFLPTEHLYGRDTETRKLANLLGAERIVLLHSPSGAGKTSLVQAALIPKMRERKFHVRPIIRVNREPRQASAGGNRYVFSLLSSLEAAHPEAAQLPEAELATLTLAAYVARRPKPAGASYELFVLDQFEEVLTLDPTDRAAKHAFFEQLGQLLEDRTVWALFAMREDYLGALDPYLLPIPNRLNVRFRLDLLGEDAARQALQKPAENAGATFAEETAQSMVDDLRRAQIQRPDGTLEAQLGPYVEPVQLQVVAYRLWDSLAAEDDSINKDDLTALGDVGQALADYYAGRVARIAAETGVSERAIREWFDRKLITEQGIRGQVLMGIAHSEGLDNRAVGAVENAHLIRGDKRGGATWYELAHDRLIEPVRANNAAWFKANLNLLQLQADIWARQNRSDSLLISGQELAQMEQAARAMTLLPAEQDFLAACRALRERERRNRRQQQFIAAGLVASLVLMVVAVVFGIQANAASNRAIAASTDAYQQKAAADAASNRANVASTSAIAASTNAYQQQVIAQAASTQANEQKSAAVAARDEAQKQRDEATHQSQIALARQLAAAALNNLGVDPERSILLALQAVATTHSVDKNVLNEAEDALHKAVQTSRVQLTLTGHTDLVYGVAFSPHDGKRLATGSWDGTAKVWDAATGRELLTLKGHTSGVNGIAFSPDGTRLATGSWDNTAKVWNAVTGQELLTLTGHNAGIVGVAFSPDGTRLATASYDKTAKVWDAATGKELLTLTGHTAEVSSIAFSPDGSRLATASLDNTAKVWDAATGRELFTLQGHVSQVWVIAFSPDGSRLATGSYDKTAKIWDAATGQELLTLSGQNKDAIRGLAFSPDGTRLATASYDRTADVWDVATGHLLFALTGHTDAVLAIAFSPDPDGLRLATASIDKTAKVWDATTGQELLTLKGHTDQIWGITFSPLVGDKRLATASSDGTAKVWDAATGKELLALNASAFGIAFSPDGKRLATAGWNGTAKVWDAATGQRLLTLTGHTAAVLGIAFSPDGTRLATASSDGTAKVWDAATGQVLLTLAGHHGIVYGIAFSPHGERLATASVEDGSAQGSAKVWDAVTGKELFTLKGHTWVVSGITFSPDGSRLATASFDNTAKVWDAATGQQLLTLTGHTSRVNGIAFSPDGSRLATASSDGTAKMWDAATGEELFTLTGHTDAVLGVAFSPDGTRLATASADHTLRIYTTSIDELMALARSRITRTWRLDECQKYLHLEACPPTP